jgi:pyrimidine-nucleoside phosphorylase
MNQPLGHAVGNALEMKEAILTLMGEGPDDFWAHCEEIASHMLTLGQRAGSVAAAREMVKEAWASGLGLDYLKRLVEAQGGDVRYVDQPERLPEAPIKSVIEAPTAGFIHEVHARQVGETAVILGAGRSKKGDEIDPAVGISVLVKVGDRVEDGQPLFVVHARDEASLGVASEQLVNAVKIADQAKDPLPLFYGLVTSD